MTRTRSILICIAAILAAAIVAVPASASPRYDAGFGATSLDDGPSAKSQAPVQTSLNAIVASHNALVGQRSIAAAPSHSPNGDFSSLTATVGATPSERPSLAQADYSSVTASVGPGEPQPAPVASAAVSAGDDFDWGAALIGAALACCLLALAFMGARTVSHQRTAGSHS